MELPTDVYIEEATELLGELETALLELEENPDDMELVGRVFRAMHTIKGSGAMFGFDAIATFTHEVETVFDQVRAGKLAVTSRLIGLTLAARDRIKQMLGGQTDFPDAGTDPLLSDLHELMTGDTAAGEKKEASPEATYRIRFKPAETIFKTGTNPVLLLRELAEMGECHVVAHTGAIPPLDRMDPESCYSFWDIILTTSCGMDAIRDVFIFVEDQCELGIDVIDDGSDPEVSLDYKKIGEILLERGDLSAQALSEALMAQRRIGDMLVQARTVSPDAVDSALMEQSLVKQRRVKQHETAAASSLRVSAEKLDVLVDLVGELVTVQARLSRKAQQEKDSELNGIAEVVERLTNELRDNTLSIRMLPLSTTFGKLRRLVRDLSAELGKNVALTTAGGETELDKTVIEQLNDPLVHIIRNSIDHGIEAPEHRQAAGKPEAGTVHLCAEHCGASVLIHIRDDGAGLDAEAIREKAVERGLIAADAQRSDKELFSLIFAPGFSTAKSVTDVSGRGVGMDVVKTAIEALRGSVEVASHRGEGTTITLKLPLTLAIIDGLLVKAGQTTFVMPLSAIEECVEFSGQQRAATHGRHIINIRGQIVPFVEMRQRFQIEGERPAIEQIVINAVDGHRVGIVVDRVIGEHQIVIKTMSRLYRQVQEISGASILGDGSVALILDVAKLMENHDAL